ncbi:MAG: hypothetical protein LBG48_02965 [Rickettsiales bacterium]|jgi:cell division protein YceG involved in septum cleavage|nr:hypothetical protein [Rickettsiales bacterium]
MLDISIQKKKRFSFVIVLLFLVVLLFLLYQTSYANCLIYNNNRNSSNLEENIDYNIKKGKNCKVLRSLEVRPSKVIGSLLINCTFNPNTDIGWGNNTDCD